MEQQKTPEEQNADPAAVTEPGQSTRQVDTKRSRPRATTLWRLVYKYGLLGAFVLLAAVFSVLRPSTFPTTDNLTAILAQNASLTLLGLGVMLPLIAQRFDLTPGYMATLAGLLAVGFQIYDNWPFWLAMVVTLLICGCVGFLNGVLIAYGKLNSLVVTLGAGSVLFGAAELYSNGTTIFGNLSPTFTGFGQNRAAGIPLPAIYAAVIAIVIWYVLRYRPSGRRLYAVGGSEEGARLVGVRVNRLILISFVCSALLSAGGGIIEASRVGSANPTDLQYTLLPAFTAAFLSATVFRPGHYNVWGTVLAVYLVGMGESGMFILGAPAFYAQVFDGLVLLVAIGLAEISKRRFARTV